MLPSYTGNWAIGRTELTDVANTGTNVIQNLQKFLEGNTRVNTPGMGLHTLQKTTLKKFGYGY